mmetsp:Transcript_4230/g.11598  ORF Transcript_4230/g.11598 Transcript_4230/m.11598 type:complete len:204 (-) Transcript_4230:97-708(-)
MRPDHNAESVAADHVLVSRVALIFHKQDIVSQSSKELVRASLQRINVGRPGDMWDVVGCAKEWRVRAANRGRNGADGGPRRSAHERVKCNLIVIERLAYTSRRVRVVVAVRKLGREPDTRGGVNTSNPVFRKGAIQRVDRELHSNFRVAPRNCVGGQYAREQHFQPSLFFDAIRAFSQCAFPGSFTPSCPSRRNDPDHHQRNC